MMWITEAFRPNHCYESGGDTWRLWIGDLAYWNENEGGGRIGPQLSFEISVGDHCGDYDDVHAWPKIPVEERKQYLTRGVSLQIWRWGISVNWRGPEIADDWDIPRYQLDRHGELLEDYR